MNLEKKEKKKNSSLFFHKKKIIIKARDGATGKFVNLFQFSIVRAYEVILL